MYFQRTTFADNVATNNVLEINRQSLYHRTLNYENTYFQFFLQIQINIQDTTLHSFTQTLYADFQNSLQQIAQRQQIFDQNTWVREEKYQIALFIYSYPKSDHTRFCSIKLIGTHDSAQINFQTFDCFYYSYYDQVKQDNSTINKTKYIMATLISRIVFYRDIHDNIVVETGVTDRFFVVFDKEQKLKFNFQLLVTKKHQFLNFDVNSFTELIDFADYNTSYSAYVCTMVSPGCDFCINYQCVRCKQKHQLADGFCVKCDGNYMLFRNKCIKIQNKLTIDNYATQINYDPNKLQLFDVSLKHFKVKGSTISTLQRNQFFLQNATHLQEFLTQIQQYQLLELLFINILEVYYVYQFKPNDYAICYPNTYYLTDSNFLTICLDSCPQFYHVVQNRFCIENDNRCEIQTETGCQKCKIGNVEQHFVSGKMTCLIQQIEPSVQYQTQYRKYDKQLIVSNCTEWTDDGKCLICDVGYMVNPVNQSCILTTAEFDLKDSSNLCSIYDNPDSPVLCIGTYSSSYILDQTQAKWTQNCVINVYFQNDCSSCQNDYLLNSMGTCEQCLSIDPSNNTCLLCPFGYQLQNNECRESTCLQVVENCINCDSNNPVLCTICDSGYLFISNGYFSECITPIEVCEIHVFQFGFYICSQCQIGYFSLDQYYKVSQDIEVCIQTSYLVSNCIQYLNEGVNWFCSQCDINYNLNELMNTCNPAILPTLNCVNFDFEIGQCSSCDTGFLCLDDQYFYSQTICNVCMDQIFEIQNCLQYDIDFICLLCMQNYFMDLVQNSFACIHNDYYIQNCIEYQGNETIGYLCSKCQINFTLQNNKCLEQQQSNQYVIQNCLYYDEKFNCIECIQNFFLVNTINTNNEIGQLCLQNIINYCQLYKDEQNCLQCQDNYIISIDNEDCFFHQDFLKYQNFYPDQYKIKYKKIVYNCLLNIEFCQSCSKEDLNICQTCQKDYYLLNNKCYYSCQTKNQKYLEFNTQKCQVNINQDYLQQVCDQNFQNCLECNIVSKVFKCLKCQSQFYLENNRCWPQQFVQDYDNCKFPCLDCDNQTNCLFCQNQFYLQNGFCVVKDTNRIQLQCQQQTNCFQQNQIVNQHCANCKNLCQIQKIGAVLYVDKNITIQNDLKMSSQDIFLKSDHQKNMILIQSKDLVNSFILVMRSGDFIQKSVNCTPENQYVFFIENLHMDTQNEILQKTSLADNYFPMLVSLIPSRIIEDVFFLVMQMKIYQYLDYLQIYWGNIGENYKTKLKQNYQIEKDEVLIQFFTNKMNYHFIFYQYQMKINFFNLFSKIQIIEIVVVIFIVVIQLYPIFFVSTPRNKKKHRKLTKQLLFKYSCFKTFQLMLNLLNQVTVLTQFFQDRMLIQTIILTAFICVSYNCYNVIINHIVIFKRIIRFKKESIKHEDDKKSLVELLSMCFLFLKFKCLFDFQDSKKINIFVFVSINLLEFLKYFVYKRFKYFLIIFLFEYLLSLGIVVFCVFSYLNDDYKDFQQQNKVHDWIFIQTTILHVLQFIATNIVFAYRKNVLQKQKNLS